MERTWRRNADEYGLAFQNTMPPLKPGQQSHRRATHTNKKYMTRTKISQIWTTFCVRKQMEAGIAPCNRLSKFKKP